MGDGTVKLVGLSLAQQAFISLWHWFAGGLLDDAHLSAGLEPCLFDFPHMLFSLKPQLKLHILSANAFLLQVFLHQPPLLN